MPSLTIRPGSRVRLKGQSAQLPDFHVIRFDGSRCWLRQGDWSPQVQLAVFLTQIAIPYCGQDAAREDGGNVTYLNWYRWRKLAR